ncbi:MAG: hypothetical protein HND39_07935 [Ignavibacteriota bacterium]|jgi:hypothetical protein|nr:MAG: hypothetical protein EDM72_09580 [Chlorobiota bacterium]MBE7476207.1 hypothetical protein [Ignavibacteriales bacterium]MBL1124488.1 hypothetical protein [Ignavibacteriota bacterium]MCC7095216.1 hypothetical protein [Ignavibacteriaceae bacterium]MCE7857726.1 hypothetical protein [Ignavibacteria bacterium CHB3]MEB2297665.1 hypothetical protein [Ignavibacteria bacterium]
MKSICAVLLKISFLFIVISGCKDEPPVVPPPPPPSDVKDTLRLTFEYATHRSIIINSKTTTSNKHSTVKLYRIFNNADTLVSEYPITTNDTSIIDDNNGNGLQLNTNYTYYTVRIDSTGERKDSGNIITITTLAATNFNYTWQEFALGDPGSVLYDVWGTDENNVYAVGGVYFNDTSFGVIHWNGVEWNVASQFGGGLAIHGFSANDIWTVGGTIYHFNGQIWDEILFNDQILVDNIPYYAVWGTNSNNVYFGSGRGKVIHWNGNKAQIVYSNADQVFVKDLDGYASDFIIGVGTGMVPPLLAIKYDGTIWNDLPISDPWSLNAVSIATMKQVYFGGDGVFEMIGNKFSHIQSFGYYIWDIKYNKQTGVTVASGAFDGVYIYNGMEWRDFRGQISSDNTRYSGIFIANNTIFCVGSTTSEAKIVIGKN